MKDDSFGFLHLYLGYIINNYTFTATSSWSLLKYNMLLALVRGLNIQGYCINYTLLNQIFDEKTKMGA